MKEAELRSKSTILDYYHVLLGCGAGVRVGGSPDFCPERVQLPFLLPKPQDILEMLMYRRG